MHDQWIRISLFLTALGAIAACGDDDGDGFSSGRSRSAASADECVDAAWAYSDLNNGCYGEDTSFAEVEEVCDLERMPLSVWPHCVAETEAMTACGERVGCDAWFTEACEDEYYGMMDCFDAHASEAPPAGECAWVNDGECDEPEGTDICAEGTDVDDCYCQWTNDGVCDEPSGTGVCPYWSDAADCS